MADFANYQDPQQERPSMLNDMFGSPMRAQWTLQKGSWFATMLQGDMWKGAMEGRGIKWTGVVGLRDIALGGKAHGSSIAKGLSPANALHGIINVFSEKKAEAFSKFGLLGRGGLLNPKGKEGWANVIGKFFGGGTISSTRFGEHATQGRNTFFNTGKYKKGGVEFTSRKSYLQSILTRKTTIGLTTEGGLGILTQGFDALGNATEIMDPAKAAKFIPGISRLPHTQETRNLIRYQKLWGKYQNSVTKEAAKFAKHNVLKGKIIRNVARIGKFATWTTAAMLAFDISSAIASASTSVVGSMADRLETTASSLVNRNMEFGGKVGVGFYSGRSGTERQRALSTIRGGYGGGMGKEAGYQHVDSTW